MQEVAEGAATTSVTCRHFVKWKSPLEISGH